MNSSLETIPEYLRCYVVEQAPDQYSAEEHASWRFIMRLALDFFSQHAVGVYRHGLESTGISIDRIPSVAAIDLALQKIGWGAVPVRGFIPPGAFLDFQARGILPIASDMRTVTNIAYTPAPDIVHEAAGHAPILVDKDYSNYLTKYAAMAQKALFCREDLELYEAIRALSDIKENPDSSSAQIEAAEQGLKQAAQSVKFVSEAQKVARMNWWTVEYGLAGDCQDPKIFGAGLLSSVGESRNCLTPEVRKIPLDVSCIDTSYDITRPQPQLYVAKDIPHLIAVLEELEQTLAYQRGGSYGLSEAIKCKTLATVELTEGLSVSGILTTVEYSEKDPERLDFFKFEGSCQLAVDGKELPNQGVEHHRHGFSSPLGKWLQFPGKNPVQLTPSELADGGLNCGEECTLEFDNGFIVSGTLRCIDYNLDKLNILQWENCRVTRGEKTYYQPEWGVFDMVVGDGVVPSVYGGAADKAAFGSHDLGQASTTPCRQTPYTEAEKMRFRYFHSIRKLRSDIEGDINSDVVGQVKELIEDIRRLQPAQWLLFLEGWELGFLSCDDQLIDQQYLAGLESDLMSLISPLSRQTRFMVRETIRLIKANAE